jgi:hypothetical protein
LRTPIALNGQQPPTTMPSFLDTEIAEELVEEGFNAIFTVEPA